MPEEPIILKELYVVIGRNEKGDEGVASYVDPSDGVMKPAIGGHSRLQYLYTIAQTLANNSGLELIIAKWASRELHATVTPEESENGCERDEN